MMNVLVESVLVFTVLMSLTLLGSSRLAVCIRIIAAQGILLAFLPLVWTSDSFGPREELAEGLTARVICLVLVSLALKGWLFPRLLNRSLRAADVRHEVEPWIGYSASIVLGVLIVAASLWMSTRFDLGPERHLVATRVLPAALANLMIGLLLICSRKTALMQVIGYLVLENGIYIFGVALARDEPFLIEMGILLDVFVAVFVMGIAIFHISREFDHIDVDRLSSLQD